MSEVNPYALLLIVREALEAANAACMVALTAAERIAALEEDREKILGLVRAHVATCERQMQRIEQWMEMFEKESACALR